MTKTKTKPATTSALRRFLIQDTASGKFLSAGDVLVDTVEQVQRNATSDTAEDAQGVIEEIADEVRVHDAEKHGAHALAGLTFRVYDRENPPAADAPDVITSPDELPEHAEDDEAELVQGELLPADAGTAAPVPSVAGELRLSSPGLAQMTAIALASHAADLKKLAKDARALGKTQMATQAEKDAQLITEDLLAQLEPQAKLPFGYADVTTALEKRISGKLRSQLSAQIRRDTPILAGETDQDRQDKIRQKIDDFESLVGGVAGIVTALVEPVLTQAAERGIAAGRLARETSADTLALEALEAIASEGVR